MGELSREKKMKIFNAIASTLFLASSAQDDCPTMSWKGKKSTKIMHRGMRKGERAYILRQTIFNNSANTPDIRSSPYTGFLIFSRRYCGVEFYEALADGTIKVGMYDIDRTYDLQYINKRQDGKFGSQVTLQYHQSMVGTADMPWDKKNGNSQKKDQMWISLTNIPDEFDVAKEAGCFNMMVGVAPTGVDGTKDYSECAAGQKDTGY